MQIIHYIIHSKIDHSNKMVIIRNSTFLKCFENASLNCLAGCTCQPAKPANEIRKIILHWMPLPNNNSWSKLEGVRIITKGIKNTLLVSLEDITIKIPDYKNKTFCDNLCCMWGVVEHTPRFHKWLAYAGCLALEGPMSRWRHPPVQNTMWMHSQSNDNCTD